MEKVNLKRLTKLEKKVLKVLAEQRVHPNGDPYKYFEGNNSHGIGEKVYNIHSEWWSHPKCNSARASISRILNRLWKKGFVKKGKPIYRSYWNKRAEWSYGEFPSFWDCELLYVRVQWKVEDMWRVENLERRDPEWYESGDKTKIVDLPYRTHVWWMLTDKGKKAVKEVSKCSKDGGTLSPTSNV